MIISIRIIATLVMIVGVWNDTRSWYLTLSLLAIFIALELILLMVNRLLHFILKRMCEADIRIIESLNEKINCLQDYLEEMAKEIKKLKEGK